MVNGLRVSFGAALFLSAGVGCEAAEARAEPHASVPQQRSLEAETSGQVQIQVEGVHSADGQILAFLFDQKKGFPTVPTEALQRSIAPSASGNVTVLFQDVDPGTYAISVVHDENENGKLDANLLGIPKEGVGASNRAVGRFGPPKWKDAKFRVDGDTKTAAALWYP